MSFVLKYDILCKLKLKAVLDKHCAGSQPSLVSSLYLVYRLDLASDISLVRPFTIQYLVHNLQ